MITNRRLPRLLLAGFCAGLLMLPVSAQSQDTPSLQFVRPDAASGTSAAVVVKHTGWVQTTQLMATDGQGHITDVDDPVRQLDAIAQKLRGTLQKCESSLGKTFKLNVYIARDEFEPIVCKWMIQTFPTESLPVATFVTTRLPHAQALVALDALATVPASIAAGDHRHVRTLFTDADSTPGAESGGRSRATVLPRGTQIYVAGQAEKADTLAEATRLTLLSLEASLKFVGREKADIAQVKCFLTPMSDVAAAYDALDKFFSPLPVPAVSMVEWQSSLPIEIEVVAYGGPAAQPPARKIEYLTPPGMTTSPIYSRMARFDHSETIFIGGLRGTPGSTGEAQVLQIFEELGSLLKETGGDFQHLAKATYYVSSEDPSQKLNEIRPRFYRPDSPPAASKAPVTGIGDNRLGIVIDMIAAPAQ